MPQWHETSHTQIHTFTYIHIYLYFSELSTMPGTYVTINQYVACELVKERWRPRCNDKWRENGDWSVLFVFVNVMWSHWDYLYRIDKDFLKDSLI